MAEVDDARTNHQCGHMVVRLSFEELLELVKTVFVRHGMSIENAVPVARTCVLAERDGTTSHGLFRVPGYLASLKAGYVDGRANPVVESDSGACVQVNGCNGFAQPALMLVRDTATERAHQLGCCIVAIRDCHHFAALWPDLELFTEAGLLAFSCVNSMSLMAPWGGRKSFYGTNPIAFAVPRAGREPLIFDQASSVISLGDVQLAALEGRQLPPGVGIDQSGQQTTNPSDVVEGGALLPYGGHKGSSIAMMVEFLAAGLTGGHYSYEINALRPVAAPTARAGQFLLLIDPKRTAGDDFDKRGQHFLNALKQCEGGRLPGDRRYQRRADCDANGIPVERRVLHELESYLS